MQRAVGAAADVVVAAPVDELVAGLGRQQHLRRGAAAQRRPHAPERVGVERRGQHAVAHLQPEQAEVAFDAPVLAAAVGELAAGHEAQLAAGAAHRRLAVGMVGHAHHQVDALERERRPLDARHELSAPLAVEHVDLRRARGRADGDLRRLAVAPGARRHRRLEPEAVERLEEVDLALDLGLRVVGADDHRVVLEERLGPAGGVHQALDLLVGGGDRRRPARTGRCGASACRCRAATAAGSRTGRSRPGARRRSPRAGRARRAARAGSGSPSCARRRCRRRRTRAGRRRRGGRRSRRAASARCRSSPRGGGGRGT